MLDNSKWSGKNEDFMLKIRDNAVGMALGSGYNVIVDDTNLHPKNESRLREIAFAHKAQFETKDFTDVPIQTCIQRDLQRLDSVGEAVIKKMYYKYLVKQEVYDPDPRLPPAIICDLDGTLALFGDANPYDRDFLADKVNDPVAIVTREMRNQGWKLILLSGREGKFEDQTKAWLDKHQIKYDALFMRTIGDTRNDAIIKQELFEWNIRDKYNILFALDDRNRVVDLWRRLGLTCFQVNYGDF